MAIQIINKGFYTIFQDSGRSQYQSMGVSPSKPMDEELYDLANALVENGSKTPCLEFYMIPPSFKALSSHVIAVTGDIEWVEINNTKAPCNATIEVHDGDVIRIGPFRSGCRGYVAIKGIKNIPVFFGSVTYEPKTKSGMQVSNNTIIEADSIGVSHHHHILYDDLQRNDKYTIRVFTGADYDRFSLMGKETFFGGQYSMDEKSNRMGIRFCGQEIEHKSGADILSRPITMGTIQVPASGQPIIMMSDHQPTGGYTVIGTVIKKDLWKLAQLKPGEKVLFHQTSIDEGIKLMDQYHEWVENLTKKKYLMPRYFSIAVNKKSYNLEVREQVDEDKL